MPLIATDCRYAAYFRPRLVAAKKEGYIGHADTPGTTPGTCAPTPTEATAADEVGGSMNAVVGGALNAVVGGAASSGSASSAASSAAVPAVRADLRRDEAIITTLAQLFIKRPSEWTVR